MVNSLPQKPGGLHQRCDMLNLVTPNSTANLIQSPPFPLQAPFDCRRLGLLVEVLKQIIKLTIFE